MSRSLKNLYPSKYQEYLQSEVYALRVKLYTESSAAKYECKKEANYICSHCGAEALDAHHIIPLEQGGSNEQSNLVCLCRKCHQQVHKNVYTVDPETKQLIPVIYPEHSITNKPEYVKLFEEITGLTMYKQINKYYTFIDNVKVIFTAAKIKEICQFNEYKKAQKEKYHKVAEMKRFIVEASKEMRWAQGKELRKFIKNYEDERDYEILVKLYNTIRGEK